MYCVRQTNVCDTAITPELDEIRAAVVVLRADLHQATLRIEEQAKRLGEVGQVRRLLEYSTYNFSAKQ
jgi:hypothetical protein